MLATHLRALLWKDFRQQRGLLIGAAMLLSIPYVIATVAFVFDQYAPHPAWRWISYFHVASVAAFALAVVLVAFFVGNSMAGERGDRSAEFMACLPIERKIAVASKAFVALATNVSMLGVFFLLVLITAESEPGRPRPLAMGDMGVMLATSGLVFGLAWLASSFAPSATYAAACGVAIPVCIAVTLGMLSQFDSMHDADLGMVYLVLCPVIGVGGFIAGTMHYMRRVEP